MRQQAVTVAEEQREVVRLVAFRLDEVAVCLHFGEGTQHNVVRQEVSVRYTGYRIDVQRVSPERVLAYVRLEGRRYYVVSEGELLAFLVEVIVVVGVLEGIDSVVSGRDALYYEVSGGCPCAIRAALALS